MGWDEELQSQRLRQEGKVPHTPQSCWSLYLAVGPQIVISAAGLFVQTGQSGCHPSQCPGSGTIPQYKGEWWNCSARLLNTCSLIITPCQRRCLIKRLCKQAFFHVSSSVVIHGTLLSNLVYSFSPSSVLFPRSVRKRAFSLASIHPPTSGLLK